MISLHVLKRRLGQCLDLRKCWLEGEVLVADTAMMVVTLAWGHLIGALLQDQAGLFQGEESTLAVLDFRGDVTSDIQALIRKLVGFNLPGSVAP